MLNNKVTINTLKEMKESGEKMVWLTAYNYWQAQLVEKAGIEMILVGDSLSMVELGHETTIPVSMEEMISHSKAVCRGAKKPFIIGDMPFGSYQPSDRDAIINAERFLVAGCDAIKCEGGTDLVCDRVKAMNQANIGVCGHLGMTPQSLAQMRGYK